MAHVQAFNADQVRKLTKLSERQLRHWNNTGFFTPHFSEGEQFSRRQRLYSFQDLVSLRVLSLLRNTYHVSLQELRPVGERLSKVHNAPWASQRFWVAGRHVVFEDPTTGERMIGRPLGQLVLPVIKLNEVAQDMGEAVDRLQRRGPDQIGHIDRNRQVASNNSTLRGTRIPTSTIWEFHEAGYSSEDILKQYPQLTLKDVEVALKYETEQRSAQSA